MKVMIIGGGNSGNQNMVTAINKAFGEGVELIIPEDQGSDPTPISMPYFHYGKMDFDIIKDVELKEPPHWKRGTDQKKSRACNNAKRKKRRK